LHTIARIFRWNRIPQPFVFIDKLNGATVENVLSLKGWEPLLQLNDIVLTHCDFVELADYLFSLFVDNSVASIILLAEVAATQISLF